MPPPKEDPQTPGDGGHPGRARGQGFARFSQGAGPGASPGARSARPRSAAPGSAACARSAPANPPHPSGAPADLHRVHPADVHVAVGDHEGAQLAAGPRREGEQRQQEQQHGVRGSHGGCGAPAALPRPAAPPPRSELNK